MKPFAQSLWLKYWIGNGYTSVIDEHQQTATNFIKHLSDINQFIVAHL